MQRKWQRALGFIPAAFSLLAACVLGIILLIVVLAQPQLQWAYSGLSLLSNAALYPAALAGIALLFWIRSREKAAPKAPAQWPVIALFLMVLAVQFLIARSCWYRMGWDILVVNNGADSVARGLLGKEHTDSFAILFPVLALFFYLRLSRPVLKWFLISLVCFFGASIKPTVLIVMIALVILGVCRFLAQIDFSPATWKRALLVAAAVIVGAIPGKVWQNETTAYLAGSAVPEGQLCETHYLMLGMNGDTYGGHSPADNEFSLSHETLSERRAATLNRAWERLTSRSLLENLRFFGIKAYKAYADGSFAAHTSFLDMEIPKRTDAFSLLLRDFYHHRGSYVEEMHTLVQCLWLGLLSLCAISTVRLRKQPAVAVLALTLLGLTAYLLLFEVWPRYAFLYAPFFLILASLAFDQPIHLKKK